MKFVIHGRPCCRRGVMYNIFHFSSIYLLKMVVNGFTTTLIHVTVYFKAVIWTLPLQIHEISCYLMIINGTNVIV